jgi:glycerate 2-kinase
MNSIRFHPDLDHAKRVLAAEVVNSVLSATDPARKLRVLLSKTQHTKPTHILAFGKASIAMTNAAIECLGDKFSRATVISLPELCVMGEFKSRFVELLPADHPLPTERSLSATKKLIEHAESIPDDHCVLVLISGGGSAMLCQPITTSSLEEIQNATQSMLDSGASIHELNETRSQLDSIKAGGLATTLSHVDDVRAYLLSDVVGDAISTIASGPLVDKTPPSRPHHIVASNQDAIEAVCAWAIHHHLNVVSIQSEHSGNARSDGYGLAEALLDTNESASKPPNIVVYGGEPTVNTNNTELTNVSTLSQSFAKSSLKSGSGGPMLELGAACAAQLASKADFPWTVITFATDGIDGPTDAAGAIFTNDMFDNPETVKQMHSSLDCHDSLTICDTLGASIRTGPTGTNVNDVAVAIRWES